MDKSTRLALIRSRFVSLFGAPSISELSADNAVPVLQTSKAEIRESVSSEVASELVAVERAELREDEGEFSSSLSFERASIKTEDESRILLSTNEKRRLSIDLDAYRAASRQCVALVLVA